MLFSVSGPGRLRHGEGVHDRNECSKEQTQMVLNYHKEVKPAPFDNAMAVENKAAVASCRKYKADTARFNALKELGAKADGRW